MVGVDILQMKDPYHNPGYTGYCPQHKFLCGETYGDLSQELLLDPDVSHAEKLALVDTTKDYEVVKPTRADIATVNARANRTDPKYKHPMTISYAGHIPNLGLERDRPVEILATQGVANFERQLLKRQAKSDHLKKIIDLQSGSRNPNTLEERLLLQSKFKLPLIAVHPERAGLQKSHPIDEKYEKPRDYSTSPYFMDNLNPQKYFVNGYTGYIPYRYTHIGKPSKKMTADGLQDFTSNYLRKKVTEWAPVVISEKKKYEMPHVPVLHTEIYKKDTALMPSYTGHVPGATYAIGKTFGQSSKSAHNYVKERLFMLKLSNFEIPPQPTQKT